MRIYFDTCTLQRPLDDRAQLRIALEADAMLAILALCEQQVLTLVVSDITIFETAQNPNLHRQAFAHALIAHATEHVPLDTVIEQRAQDLERAGIKAIDALHYAAAERAQVDFFCTCDDRFYRKLTALSPARIRVVTPLELAQEVLP